MFNSLFVIFLIFFSITSFLSSSINCKCVTVDDISEIMVTVDHYLITEEDFIDKLILNDVDFNVESFTNFLIKNQTLELMVDDLIKKKISSRFIVHPKYFDYITIDIVNDLISGQVRYFAFFRRFCRFNEMFNILYYNVVSKVIWNVYLYRFYHDGVFVHYSDISAVLFNLKRGYFTCDMGVSLVSFFKYADVTLPITNQSQQDIQNVIILANYLRVTSNNLFELTNRIKFLFDIYQSRLLPLVYYEQELESYHYISYYYKLFIIIECEGKYYSGCVR